MPRHFSSVAHGLGRIQIRKRKGSRSGESYWREAGRIFFRGGGAGVVVLVDPQVKIDKSETQGWKVQKRVGRARNRRIALTVWLAPSAGALPAGAESIISGAPFRPG